jgi:exoribonuclease-2
MEPGQIVEYIDNQKIVCAVVLGVKNHRLRVLTEANRESNLGVGRLSYKCDERLNLSQGRDKLVGRLKDTAANRRRFMKAVDVEKLWHILQTEAEWIDLDTMASFCFNGFPTADQKSAVIRTFFKDRTYFKFDHNRFFPYSEEKVAQIIAKAEEQAARERLVKVGGDWLKKNLSVKAPVLPAAYQSVVDILTSCYLHGKDSAHHEVGKAILARAGVQNDDNLFRFFVRLGVWDENEHLELARNQVPVLFSEPALADADRLASVPAGDIAGRVDLRGMSLITIDGAATLDFDDALSIEEESDGFRVGIHIADVGHYIKRGDVLDREAMERGSSIYFPDGKDPMFPPRLSENLCSLLAGEARPAISLFVRLDHLANPVDCQVVPSIVSVHEQLTYTQADKLMTSHSGLTSMHTLAKAFRRKRLSDGAVQIILPEIVVRFEDDGSIQVHRIDREGPSRMLVAEMMILANWMTARHLSNHKLPAIFRSQPEPRTRLIKEGRGTFFQNCQQRKNLSRLVLSLTPERHAGLGLDAYVTATSPIRKYSDLVTQRQIRATLGLEEPYTTDEINRMVQALEQPLQTVSRIQFRRHRYWLIKYLENAVGSKEEAVVLDKRRDGYVVMLPNYMLECRLPLSSNSNLKPGDLVQVTVQRANARNDILSVF